MILDLGLPDLSGQEVLRRLREWSNVPVIILSVQDDEAGKVAALDAGADDYVTKPFNTSELLARLRVGLRHRGPSRQLLVRSLDLDQAFKSLETGFQPVFHCDCANWISCW